MLLKETLTTAVSFGIELTRQHILTVWFGGNDAKPKRGMGLNNTSF